ncbi:MAG: GTPase-associated system all-helical protein GASH [Armatimonadota bacterium]
MASSVLTEFLRKGLIQGIDDQDYERLTKASGRIKERLSNDFVAIRRYCIAVLDEQLPDVDPTLDEIQKDIEEEWKTFPGKFTTRPVALLRAVGIQALVDVAEESSSASRILWLTGSTPVEHMVLGAEQDLLRSLFVEWGTASEENAEEEWKNAESFDAASSIGNDKLKIKTFDAKSFGVVEGSPLTPEVVAPVIESLAQQLTSLANQNALSISKSLTASLNTALTQIEESTKRRLSLLWWKQTLYSPSQKKGYRAIQSPEVRIFALALDLDAQLPDTYPQSVEYLLRETVFELVDSWQGSVAAFCTALISDKTLVNTLTALCDPQEGRVPLLTFISAAARGEVQATDAASVVGVPDDMELSGADIAVWLLRELSADTLATQE